MATTTTNLGLTKPVGTEQALISVINGNMDIIDSKVGAVPANKNVQGEIDSLSDHIANIGKMLTTDTITPSTTNKTITDFSKYSLFMANMVSDSNSSGVAVGYRFNNGNVRFAGTTAGTTNVDQSLMILYCSGDTITSVTAFMGASANGIKNIIGIV